MYNKITHPVFGWICFSHFSARSHQLWPGIVWNAATGCLFQHWPQPQRATFSNLTTNSWALPRRPGFLAGEWCRNLSDFHHSRDGPETLAGGLCRRIGQWLVRLWPLTLGFYRHWHLSDFGRCYNEPKVIHLWPLFRKKTTKQSLLASLRL